MAEAGRERVLECIAPVDLGGKPEVTVTGRTTYDGLDIEYLSWQLPWGPQTEAVFLKPAGATGRLPAILALHDHGGNKFLGWRKIARTDDDALGHSGPASGAVLRRRRVGERDRQARLCGARSRHVSVRQPARSVQDVPRAGPGGRRRSGARRPRRDQEVQRVRRGA